MPADIQQQIAEVTSRLVEVNKAIADEEKSALAHEAEARAARLRRDELKIERKGLNDTLVHSGVIQQTNAAAEAARASQAVADQAAARMAEKEKELDALIAKAKAAAGEA